MLVLNQEKLKSVYVYILKLTPDYVYVTKSRSGAPYRETTTTQDEYRGYSVSKVSISKGVYDCFYKIYCCKEFAEPRLASLNMYEGDIVSIEIQISSLNAKNGDYVDPENWQSFFSKSLPILGENVGDNTAWINGSEIFWLSKDVHAEHFINPEKSLSLREVNFVRLGTMGISVLAAIKARKEIKSNEAVENDSVFANRATLRVLNGRVLTYYPNAGVIGAEGDIQVYSPVLQDDSMNDIFNPKANKTASEERKVFRLGSGRNSGFANIDFIIRAGALIGRLYGAKEIEYLDVPRIVEQTSCVNFHDISEHSRKITPTHITDFAAIAYIFRFIYKEKNMMKLRQLCYMFRFCLRRGLVYESTIAQDKIFKGNESLPLHELQSV